MYQSILLLRDSLTFSCKSKEKIKKNEPTRVEKLREDMERMTLRFSVLEEFDRLSKALEEITPISSHIAEKKI
ncbi:hypothetical protein RHMOL_Rhmol06G0316600 [Rhododendron molle]|uniref:Uncharacterized protein n=1 Tax=Rhododendron molle TaxID=49168 RepID=A0ACC0NJK6_RHOML|nr:hypothetical protein RHMOL_Rhmol06G0316600 [Rhododendron molle]